MEDVRRGGELHRILYISRAKAVLHDDFQWNLDQIAQSADAANRSRGITGVLMGYDGWFVQALEGPHGNLSDLYDRIQADPRHEQVVLVSDEEITERQFPEWGMKAGRSPAWGEAVQLDALTTSDLVFLLMAAVGSESAAKGDVIGTLTIIDTLLL